MPYEAVADVMQALSDVSDKILIDIANPIMPDYMALTIDHTTSAAEEIQKRAPTAHVVKVLNTILADLLQETDRASGNIQVFTAANDPAHAAIVADLIREMGFKPVPAGPLANARYLEPLGEVNIHLGHALGHGTRIAPVWMGLAV